MHEYQLIHFERPWDIARVFGQQDRWWAEYTAWGSNRSMQCEFESKSAALRWVERHKALGFECTEYRPS